ncbi:putative lipoprotein [Thiopseudomonas denitrificans]|uniref:Putative lipoprotein n=2 Tax=Thiopseudomonas denitrificans TaxID=1501432 RepID=A0A4R6TYC5_9GAMM|nr:putative lipoprotein [Thiopseudomonas denitrificans]
MQYRIMKLLAVLALASGLAACGLSPQQARPEPRLSGQLAKVAAGQRVSVHISDGRSSPVLGSRGGLYGDSNALSVEGRTFMPRLQAEVEAGLRMRGFDIQPQGQAPATFDLQVTGLTYAVTEGRTVMSDVQLTATYLVRLRKDGRNYEGSYTAKLKKKFVKPPTDKANDRLVSMVMSDALQRVFEDRGISDFLAR